MQPKQIDKFQYVTVSKGLTICLMVIGHSQLPWIVSRWIWSFHMPFFFIVSALFSNFDSRDIKTFTVHKTRALIRPFLVYSLIVWLLIGWLNGDISAYGIRILTDGWGGIALWFVPVFWLSLLITRLIPKSWLPIASIILLLSGAALSKANIILPWTLSSVPFGASMMCITRYFSLPIRRFVNDDSLKHIAIFGSLGLLASLLVSHFCLLDMACNHINPIIPILIGIAGGCTFIFMLSHLIVRFTRVSKAFFTEAGKNTYEIMALSQGLLMLINTQFKEHILIKYILLALALTAAIAVRRAIARYPDFRQPI